MKQMNLKNITILISIIFLFAARNNLYAEYLTPPVWQTTEKTFLDGRLIYKDINAEIAPGCKNTVSLTKELIVWSYEDIRDTFLKSPEIFEEIYKSGLVQNYVEYKKMVSDNWDFSKLSLNDFAEAKEAYVKEGNWGILQTAYYSLKGSVRVIWALGILNSAEALYKVGSACVQTVYYVFRYPVKGTVEAVAAPIVFVGGTVWSTGATVVTTGWALPLTLTADAGILVKETICGE